MMAVASSSYDVVTVSGY